MIIRIALTQLTDEAREVHSQLIERAEIASLVRSRMDSLGIDTLDYDDVSEKRSSLSYVIINPSCDLKLEEGDIMWVWMNVIGLAFIDYLVNYYLNLSVMLRLIGDGVLLF